MIFMHCKYR